MASFHPPSLEIPWESSLCFTGHRPEKLPQGAVLTGLNRTLQLYICRAVELGFTHFLTGMADGVDYLAADHLFRLRMAHPEIRIIGIQPCEDYERFFRWRGYSVPHLRLMQENVDQLIVLPGSAWDRGIFLKRNRYMVDRVSAIIAVCDEGRSGSMQTFRYAQSQGLSYCRIYPEPPPGTIPAPKAWPVDTMGFSL